MENEKVAAMFDSIATEYDFLNRLLSLRIDRIWRRKLRKMLDKTKPLLVLDVATGTGDLALECAGKSERKIIGVDISEKMLAEGRKKIAKKKLDNRIELLYGAGENLQFEAQTFDAVTVGFGLRNFENLEKGLREMHRITKPAGKVFILDFSMPRNPIVLKLYRFYFFKILPAIGKALSGNGSAYEYLPESVTQFPRYEKMTQLLTEAGYKNTNYRPLTFGIATIYWGEA